MTKPTFKKKEIAGCAGCALLGLNPAFVSWPCVPLWVAAAV